MYTSLFPHALFLFCNLQHFSLHVPRFKFFDVVLALDTLIRHSRIFLCEFSLSSSFPSTHLQFFISRSGAFSFRDICASLSPPCLSLSRSHFLSSIRLFIRFHSPIVHTFTIALLHADLFVALSAFPSV